MEKVPPLTKKASCKTVHKVSSNDWRWERKESLRVDIMQGGRGRKWKKRRRNGLHQRKRQREDVRKRQRRREGVGDRLCVKIKASVRPRENDHKAIIQRQHPVDVADCEAMSKSKELLNAQKKLPHPLVEYGCIPGA